MLKIYFGDLDNEVYNPPTYFLNQYEEDWITTDLSKEMILDPEDYIDSSEYFSWERYFTALLINETKNSYMKYSKESLNEVFLHDNESSVILDAMDVVGEILFC